MANLPSVSPDGTVVESLGCEWEQNCGIDCVPYGVVACGRRLGASTLKGSLTGEGLTEMVWLSELNIVCKPVPVVSTRPSTATKQQAIASYTDRSKPYQPFLVLGKSHPIKPLSCFTTSEPAFHDFLRSTVQLTLASLHLLLRRARFPLLSFILRISIIVIAATPSSLATTTATDMLPISARLSSEQPALTRGRQSLACVVRVAGRRHDGGDSISANNRFRRDPQSVRLEPW